MEQEQPSMQELYRLARENNRMLHSMRRHAFWGGLIRFLLYAALLFVPAWLYLQYLSPIVDQMLKTMQQVQGTGAQAEVQLQSFQSALKELEAKIPGFGQGSQQQSN